MFRRFVFASAALWMAALINVPAQALQGTPTQVVDHFHASLLKVMREAKTLGYPGRYDTLAPVVADVFNLRYMAEFSAGSFWSKLTPEQRDSLVAAFSKLTTATYAFRFDGFNGERFETITETPGRSQSAQVNTRIVKANDEAIELNYVLREVNGEWRVIDIFLKGAFSELATRRSEYSTVIRREGLPTLLARIETRVADFANGKGTK